jgi:hypothetical protein
MSTIQELKAEKAAAELALQIAADRFAEADKVLALAREAAHRCSVRLYEAQRLEAKGANHAV